MHQDLFYDYFPLMFKDQDVFTWFCFHLMDQALLGLNYKLTKWQLAMYLGGMGHSHHSTFIKLLLLTMWFTVYRMEQTFVITCGNWNHTFLRVDINWKGEIEL
jgi:hypothetical protein